MLGYWVQSVTSVIDSKQARIYNFFETNKSGREVVFIAMGTQRPFTEKLECKFRLHFRWRVLDLPPPPSQRLTAGLKFPLCESGKFFLKVDEGAGGNLKCNGKIRRLFYFLYM